MTTSAVTPSSISTTQHVHHAHGRRPVQLQSSTQTPTPAQQPAALSASTRKLDITA